MRISMKHFVAPTLLTLAAMGVGTGCSDAKNAAGSCSLSASVDAFGEATAKLTALEASVTSSVGLACAHIATDLGSTKTFNFTAGTKAESADVQAACDEATLQLNTAFEAAGTGGVKVVVVPPKCEVDASAQLDCQASCNAEAKCEAPSIEAECDAGNLSGTCSAECKGSCTVTADVAATCSGSCSGTCDGTCTGQAGTTSNGGACEGTCEGKCKGDCKVEGTAAASCTGSCSGGCSVAYTAPKCSVALKEPSCTASADCNAGCKSSASFDAKCTKPAITVEVSATANAKLKSTLETNLPVLVQLTAQFDVAKDALTGVATAMGKVATNLSSAGAGCVQAAANFTANATAAAKASANVSVSFSASASVSGKASGGT